MGVQSGRGSVTRRVGVPSSMNVPVGGWTLEVFATDSGDEPFTRFMDDLSDAAAVALDAALNHVLAVRGMDLAKSEWLKPLGQGLHEFRVRHTADEIRHMFADEQPGVAPDPESILLRVFVHFHGQKVVLLLSGYDKQDDANSFGGGIVLLVVAREKQDHLLPMEMNEHPQKDQAPMSNWLLIGEHAA